MCEAKASTPVQGLKFLPCAAASAKLPRGKIRTTPMSQYFSSFVEDQNNQPLVLEQQAQFIEEGRQEQELLKRENQELQIRVARILTIDEMQQEMRPFKDGQNR